MEAALDLFDQTPVPRNLLPFDGEALYFGLQAKFPVELGPLDQVFRKLLVSIDWKHDEIVIFGKRIVTKRKVAWYADRAFDYRYSGMTKTALPWTEPLKILKQLVEDRSGETYNSCLLNLYHNGSEGMGWHSDNEKELKKDAAIASLSLGAPRKFVLKHKLTGEKVEQLLEDGSLLVMRGVTQSHWVHTLPTTKKVSDPRINLTFRTVSDGL